MNMTQDHCGGVLSAAPLHGCCAIEIERLSRPLKRRPNQPVALSREENYPC